MVPMRGGKTVEAFHEPFPLIPSFSPSGGEGARRAVEGDSDRFMASIHVRILEVSPLHEPGGARLRRALISVVGRSGLDGVSPHRSLLRCAVGRPWELPMNLVAADVR